MLSRDDDFPSLTCTTTPCPTTSWPLVTWKGSGAHMPLSSKPLEPYSDGKWDLSPSTHETQHPSSAADRRTKTKEPGFHYTA
ncbi:unnamed protein product [Spirodela intermedia]|uniref:Uncharacterized protein n=1 Tax=Spirodela intermedia TaxID=51605 RepID=A0ABN7E8J8_SPIIN|nr:unnamed protein product [Spirodela intermedia]